MAVSDVLAAYDRFEQTKNEWDKNRFKRAVRSNLKDIFNDPDNPSRHARFSFISERIGAFDDDADALKKFLVEAGAVRIDKGESQADEIWHLPASNASSLKIFLLAVGVVALILAIVNFVEPQPLRCILIDMDFIERTLGDRGKC